jgi:hypothetical protein
VALGDYLVPIFALLYGLVLLGEPFTNPRGSRYASLRTLSSSGVLALTPFGQVNERSTAIVYWIVLQEVPRICEPKSLAILA